MVDGYVVQQVGITYSALEMRRSTSAVFANQGVAYGLAVTVSTGQVVVAPGVAVINDAQPVPAYYIAEVDVGVTLSVPLASSGTRADTLYIAVNDSPGALTVNGVTIPIGAVYVARASSGASLPAQYVQLGIVTATTTAISYANTGRAQTENTSVVGRYLRRDTADTLAAGTGAAPPVGPTDVVIKSYVDALAARDPFQRWYWGGLAGYGPVSIPDGSANVPVGAAHQVTMTSGHLYRITSQYTLKNFGSGTVGAQMLLMINNSLAPGMSGQTYLDLLTSQTANVNHTWSYACTATGNYTVSTAIGASVPNVVVVNNPLGSPYTEFVDMGPGHF